MKNIRIIYILLLSSSVIIACGQSNSGTNSPQQTSSNELGPYGLWHGSGWGKVRADLELVTVSINYDFDFWFIINSNDQIEGKATVVYDHMKLHDNELMSKWKYAQSVSASALGITSLISGPLSQIIGTSMSASDKFVGLSQTFDEVVPIRSFEISGRLVNGEIEIEANMEPDPIMYSQFVVYVDKTDKYGQKEMPVNPFTSSAKVEKKGASWIAYVEESKITKANSAGVHLRYWSAIKSCNP